jgi:hypothetical protein
VPVDFSVSRAGSSEFQKSAGAAHTGESRLPESSGSQKSELERERERERDVSRDVSRDPEHCCSDTVT